MTKHLIHSIRNQRASYERMLDVLRYTKDYASDTIPKVDEVLGNIREVGVDVVTVTNPLPEGRVFYGQRLTAAT